MAAAGSLALVRGRRLAQTADVACALSLEALQGSRASFQPEIHELRPLEGQRDAAANIHRLLEGSAILEAHRWCDKVQDAYSLRCARRCTGRAAISSRTEATVTVELNAATDNPLVFVELDELVSNGNFHGQPLAFALDATAMALAELASISERRVERSEPVALGRPAGVPHARRWAQLRVHDPPVRRRGARQREQGALPPAAVDSIPTSAGQEDHVSMGNAAGLKCLQVLANAEAALAIELLAGAQGIEFLALLEPGAGVRAAHDFVRSLSPTVLEDRPLSGDIEALAGAIRSGELVAAVEREIGSLR